MKKSFKLENIKAYKTASELSDYIWEVVIKWEWFSKRSLGIQWTTATDSIAGNIAEGFGRFHKKNKVKFYYNSRASVFESAHWCKKAFKRELISRKEKDYILGKLREFPREINSLIKRTIEKLQH